MTRSTKVTTDYFPTSNSGRLIAFGYALCLFGITIGDFSIWLGDTERVFLFDGTAITVGALLLILGIAGELFTKSRTLALQLGALVGLGLVFCSTLFSAPYNFFLYPTIRSEIVLLGIAAFITRFSKTFFRTVALGGLFLLVAVFFLHADGRLIFSDDHPTFLYRLAALRENFPWIPFYSPAWNGGVDAREYFATGALNVFFIFAPFIYFFPLEAIYNGIAIAIVSVLPAGSMFLAAKIARFSPRAVWIATIFALGTSTLWFRWGLTYGTIGFLTSAALTPLVIALAGRILVEGPNVALKIAIAFGLTLTLTLFWSPAGLFLLPVVLALIFSSAWLFRRRSILIVFAVIALINLGWITLFVAVSKVGTFIVAKQSSYTDIYARAIRDDETATTVVPATGPSPTTPTVSAHAPFKFTLDDILHPLREATRKAHPLILFFALPGIFLLKSRVERHLFLSLLLWVPALATYGVFFLPQLDLDRLLVILLFTLSLPTALMADLCFRPWSDIKGIPVSLTYRIGSILVAGFIVIGPLCSASILQNRSLVQYNFAQPIVADTSRAIRDYGGTGRTLFAGCILHEFGGKAHHDGGHIAPLALWGGHELMASSQVHDIWKYADIIPPEFSSAGEAGIEEFLDLFNVTAIISHERKWYTYFLAHPQKYREVWHSHPFVLFQRRATNAAGEDLDFFLSGRGEILATHAAERVVPHKITLRIDSESAILRYRYYRFLESSACELKPFRYKNFDLIEISNCKAGTTLTIQSKPGWQRVRDLWERP